MAVIFLSSNGENRKGIAVYQLQCLEVGAKQYAQQESQKMQFGDRIIATKDVQNQVFRNLEDFQRNANC